MHTSDKEMSEIQASLRLIRKNLKDLDRQLADMVERCKGKKTNK